tara:strand:+ start:142 stop:336 length:195 start_codon:yes stop_codon:yes gene_type:complete
MKFGDVEFGLLCTMIVEENAIEFEKLGSDDDARDALLKKYCFEHLVKLREAQAKGLKICCFGVN